MFKLSEKLQKTLLSAYQNKGPGYQARTRYLDENKQPIYINRLILEDSPYLLQHAHNPVNWFPWGEEAFDIAKQENKPVFLSIGYSTCHWCHVMEEESFDNEDIARHMNDFFICIKVDRELHSDVDTYYMTAVMMMQGQGGWPMSSFLTPDRKPFFGGTYFQPGQFIALMSRVNEVWQNQTTDILEQASAISQQVSGAMAARQSLNEIGTNIIDLTAQTIINHYDRYNGGFGQAPKFPHEPYLYFLLEYASYSGSSEVMDAAINTLHVQSCGGIYDQIGGGFHRYATDQNWLIPHFEKMLYNQANLSFIFARTYSITRAPDFKRVACETLDYVIREMTSDEGSFYSATDADSEGEEGLFFIWQKKEIASLLSIEDAEELSELYQVTEAGNFDGKNILNLAKPLELTAKEKNIDYDALIKRLANNKKILWEYREKRIPPLRDDKVITAWNAMMIKAFAYAGQQLNNQPYITSAIKAANTLLKTNLTSDGCLSRSSLDGQASIPALQEDYAYLAEALLQLYDATLDRQWLDKAVTLCNEMLERFWDENNGGLIMSSQGEENLLPSSPREINDNATSSGNSVALRTLVRLFKRTGQQHFYTYAQQLIRAYSDDITQRPYICSYLICGLLDMLAGEQSDKQWCAEGNIHISASCTGNGCLSKIILSITANKNWHLNQINDEENALPIKIETDGFREISDINYPEPVSKSFEFQTDPLNIYEGNIKIEFTVSGKSDVKFPDNLLKLKLQLQACNNEKCLAPENVVLNIML
ncbi:MAG: thioredoxin domain-containing protein [Proteobacteria bacterium]|nr:thioredoxin domain-containing protein [Pseudomonadota bacterium]NOG61382.1 thioredoxin domain-containing protein [Pseudomonadota bacterium]